MKKFVVYILRTSRNTLYTGQTDDLDRRLKEHRERKYGAKYLRQFDDFKLVYSEMFKSRSLALKREAEFKSWPKIRKEKLVFGSGGGDLG